MTFENVFESVLNSSDQPLPFKMKKIFQVEALQSEAKSWVYSTNNEKEDPVKFDYFGRAFKQAIFDFAIEKGEKMSKMS